MILGPFGTITPNLGANQIYGNLQSGGLSDFISNTLAFLAVIGGIIVFVNFILAGYQYLSANGNAQTLSNASFKMLDSLIGLLVIVSAFVIASVIGLVFFGDATYLISPTFLQIIP
jgi:hypothetical protein